jgi:2-amino-4-hydroxy-6-hydroxymethyldihydropteridine diphosphokinase
MHTAYLGLGTNLGRREENLRKALSALEQHVGKLLKCSSFMETAPWGFPSDNAFLNAVAMLQTNLSPSNLLAATRQIEISMGRIDKTKSAQYADRTIDIDILFYDDLTLNNKDLVIPHPLLCQRLFVLLPLEEIAPELMHPLLHKSIHQLRIELEKSEKSAI